MACIKKENYYVLDFSWMLDEYSQEKLEIPHWYRNDNDGVRADECSQIFVIGSCFIFLLSGLFN